MDLIDRIDQISDRISKNKSLVQTEEASKNAFVMPFIGALGYDVFNPMEVVPEFTADIGTKKGEKVDYAIIKDDKPIIIIECKHWQEKLDVHKTQLHRYFHVTEAKFGLLTNGIDYRFYTDIEEPNKMDDTPFLSINLESYSDHDIFELKKFNKDKFNIDKITSSASDLKYSKELKKVLNEEMLNPSDDFVKLLTNRVYDGRVTSKILEQFHELIKKSAKQLIDESINDRLKIALGDGNKEVIETENNETTEEIIENENGIITTDEELEGYRIVQAIIRKGVNLNDVTYRDTKSYFGILYQDNNRKPICRLHFNRKQKYIGLFDEEKKETKYPINDLSEIYNYDDKLNETINLYSNQEIPDIIK